MALTKRDNSAPTTLLSGGAQKIKSKIAEENTSHVIERLTKLYSNPIEASVREAYSNAYDATMARRASERKPIEITNPTSFNPEFILRDYGLGMSLEMVTEVYVNYGATTKVEDLNAIGSHGLGGKAPLAYGNHFKVVTTHEGVTTSFTMERSGGNVETTIHFSEFTGAESGTTVTIPVQQEDVAAFRAVSEIYRDNSWTLPTIIDGVEFFGAPNYITIGEIPIYEDSEVSLSGEIRVNRKSVEQYFNALARPSYFNFSTAYTIGGWVYPSDGRTISEAGSSGRDTLFKVEILPAIVEFSSSRDAITKNARLQTLNSMVRNALVSPEFYDRVIGAVRQLKGDELVEFDGSLYADTLRIVKDPATNEFAVQLMDQPKADYLRPLRDFNTDEGFDLEALTTRELNKTVIGFFRWSDSSQERFQRGTLGSREHQFYFPKTVYTGVRKLSDVTSSYDGLHDLVEIARGHFGSDRTLVYVMETDQVNYKKFIRNREALFSGERSKNTYAFGMSAFSALSETDQNLVRGLLGENFSMVTATGLLNEIAPDIQRINAERRARRKELEAKANEVTIRINASRVNADDNTSPETFLKTAKEDRYNLYPLGDLVDEDAFIIIGNDWRSAYRGAINNGHALHGRPLYRFNGTLSAATAKEFLKIRDRIYFATNPLYRHRAGQELVVDRVFQADVLNTELSSYSIDELISNVLREVSNSINTTIYPYLKANAAPGSEQEYFFGILEGLSSRKFVVRLASGIVRKELERRGETERLNRALNFVSVYENFISRGPAAAAHSAVVRGAYTRVIFDETDPTMTFILDRFLSELNDDALNAPRSN